MQYYVCSVGKGIESVPQDTSD